MPKAYSYIRFSTPEQAQGDSERRQIEIAKQYCKEQNPPLELDNQMTDKGLSGYSAAHRRKGQLGIFLKKVKSGEIERGSYLLVENMDRLSREKPTEALDLFMSIIKAGIILVVLTNKKEFTKESLDNQMGELYMVVGEIQRAHSESKRKSELVRAARKRSRENLHREKSTRICPIWLKPIDDQNGGFHFEKIPDICKSIEQIFKLKVQYGWGTAKIAGWMNDHKSSFWAPPSKAEIEKAKEEGKDLIGSKRNIEGGWRESFVTKLLTNRSLIGEFQPHTIQFEEDSQGNQRKVRKPEGPAIKNYYPNGIRKELFNEVQAKLSQNRNLNKGRGGGGGKNDKAKNLFSYMAVCGLCGAPLRYINPGTGSKNGHPYLRCDTSLRRVQDGSNNTKCNAKKIPYREFVEIVFENFKEIDVSELFGDYEETKSKQQEIKKDIKEKEAEIVTQENIKEYNQDKLNTEFGKQTKSKAVLDNYQLQIDNAIAAREKVLLEVENLYSELESLKVVQKERQKQLDIIASVFQKYRKSTDENERKDIRFKLRQALRDAIEEIKVFPLLSPSEEQAQLDKKIEETREQIKSLLRSKRTVDSFKAKIIEWERVIEEGNVDGEERQRLLKNIRHARKRIEELNPEIRKLSTKQIRLSDLLNEKRKLENPEDHIEPGIALEYQSKHIDKIHIIFRGPGIKEDDEYGDMIQRRTVRLRRYVYTEDFTP